MPLLSDFTLRALDGTPLPLAPLAGQVVLVVNVASACGYTPQYTGLEALWRRYRDRGFTVLGCPCNQFGGQEPAGVEEIATFCATTYDVTFPLSEKLDVNGSGAHPLWTWMQQERPGLLGTTAIKWNFTKFLIGRDGTVHRRYAPTTEPADLAEPIERLLGTPGGSRIVTPPHGTAPLEDA
ncbi:MAG: glutathione peroxidase [Gemmatimonadetes bacterium]|nr:glutathione peroxidase [Gemmatimonadota bacterium]